MTARRRVLRAFIAAAIGTAFVIAAVDSAEHVGESTGSIVQQGELDFALGKGTWVRDSAAGPVPVSPGTRFAPGDVFVLDQPLLVTMTDQSLRAQVSLDVGDLVPAPAAPFVTVVFSAPTLGEEIASSTYQVTAADAGEIGTTVTVTISPDLPQDISEGMRLSLDALRFTMRQATT